jgi:hypothetical protein
MDAHFSLPYSEFAVIDAVQKELQKNVTNNMDFSFYIPVSRQEKGIDFILLNKKTNRVAKFQVKSSRFYPKKPKRENDLIYHFWFNNFINKYTPGVADYYILFGLYPDYDLEKKINSEYWNQMILCVPDNEMAQILKKVLTKKEQKQDRFFALSFNSPKEIHGSRGFVNQMRFEQFLLSKQILCIKDFLR